MGEGLVGDLLECTDDGPERNLQHPFEKVRRLQPPAGEAPWRQLAGAMAALLLTRLKCRRPRNRRDREVPTMKLAIRFGVAVLLVAVAAGPSPSAQTARMKQVMQTKLDHSQRILEAVVTTFLSVLTRVQADRKQRVVSTGVYGFVRHPMYLGMLLMFTGAPFLLGSRLGLVIAAAIVLILAVRITREERLLADELDGYEEYRRRVRYRLLPLIW
jgi:protein-S-isoprenylcysteine O-methyltransferase Ste14